MDFDEITEQTWRIVALFLTNDALLSEAGLIRDRLPDCSVHYYARELERLLRNIYDAAQYDERVSALELLANAHPIGSVQWAFIAESLSEVVVYAAGADFERSSWDERAEEAFSSIVQP